MPKRPALVCQADVTRLLKAARAAGYPNPRVEIEPGGTLVLVAENPAPPPAPVVPDDEAPNPWDEAV
ncbi:hypothetical protein [Xanthobacter versatilis]|uniref:hypothetical protein n=1 Tax=Xanthobacter autotrophicus (strain ATCC BAA-1158 / Py2) TaxID=78245 RepID=UPI003729EC92